MFKKPLFLTMTALAVTTAPLWWAQDANAQSTRNCSVASTLQDVDFTGDGVMDDADLQYYVENFLNATKVVGQDKFIADLNCDRVIDHGDIHQLLALYEQFKDVDTGGGVDPVGYDQAVIDQYPDAFLDKMPLNSPFLGMNLEAHNYYSGQWTYCNVAKHIGSGAGKELWYPMSPGSSNVQNWGGQTFNQTSQGLPIATGSTAAAGLIFRDVGGAYPTGDYEVSWDGSGQVDAFYNARIVDRPTSNTAIMRVSNTDNAGILFQMHSMDSSNPMRNLEIKAPNCEGKFHPLVIERLKAFSIIRFLDWIKANHSNATSFSDVNFDMHTGMQQRVTFADQVDLVNEVGADMWVTIPHKFTDQAVLDMANFLQANLDPERKVIMEYSNEVWNGQFSQHGWARDTAYAMGIDSELRDNSLDILVGTFVGYKTKRFADIMESVLGDERVLVVAPGQDVNVRWAKAAVDKIIADGGDVDIISYATYFGGPETADSSLDAFFADLTAKMDVNASTDKNKGRRDHQNLRADTENRLGHEVKIIAYEGGPHTIKLWGTYNSIYDQAQQDPRMLDVYKANLENFVYHGGDGTVMFNFVREDDKYGVWGHLTRQDSALNSGDGVKLRALLEFANELEANQPL